MTYASQDFWFQSSQDQLPGNSTEAPARFTSTPTSLCVIAFNEPSSNQVVVQKRLPLLPGDKIFLLHPNATVRNTELEWNMGEDGKVTIMVSEEQTKDVRNAWAFQIVYNVA